MIGELIGAKLRIVRGSMRSSQEGRTRAPIFLALSAIFAGMLYNSSLWLVNNAMELQPIGGLLVQKIVGIAFLIFLGILVFSNIVTAFSTYYLSDDLEFLMAQPIPPNSMFTSRYIEALAQSSWVIVLFGMPAFTAFGVGLEASWTYYVMLPLVFLPFVAIPTGLATIFALAITNLLVASRMRDALMFLGMIGFALLFLVIRLMQPEKLLNPGSFDSLGQMMDLLSAPKYSFLPSDWAVSVLSPLMFGNGEIDPWGAGLLYLTPAAMFFVSAWMHRRWYVRGFSRAQEGRHGDSLLTVLRDKMLQRQRRREGTVEHNLAEMAKQEGDFRSLRGLFMKDWRIFTRDASQWSNLLVIVAIMTIYLVNYKYFEIISDQKLYGEVGLYFFNLAVCGFVVVALGGRFLFPAISVEGRSFWLLMQAPISLERILVGKWLGAVLPVAIVGQGVIWTSNLLVEQNWFYMLVASILVLFLTFCVAAIAVGMGAIYPQFYNPNAASIASSFGALIYMIGSIFMVLISLACTFRLITRGGRMIVYGEEARLFMWDYVTAAAGLIMPIVIAYLAIKLGAMSLRRRM